MKKIIAKKKILKNLKENNLAIFAGAGMSMSSGYVNWSNLLNPLAEEIDLDVDKEDDLVSLAQYHCNEFSRSGINQVLLDEFSRDLNITENHKILAKLPISTYWTTNYDKLIEKSLNKAGKTPDVKYTINQLANTKPKRDAIVYKMHGDIDHPSKAIITKDDYEKYHLDMKPFLTNLAGDLCSKTFLFIGFSFSDPNLDYILSRVRARYGENQRRHYCFLRKLKKDEGEEQADYEYRKRKQELFINDLERFNIYTILIDKYSEITDFLKKIEKSYKSDTVFVSGAAHEYGSWGKEESEKFIYDLSKNLIRNKFKIVSGFGLGVGSAVISGALEEIYSNLDKHSKNHLILRPFPQNISDDEERAVVWSDYRKDMISYAGIAIFLFGNKIVNGEVVKSDGMRKEFKIAKENNLILLPIGATGYIAKDFHNEIVSNIDDFYPDLNQKLKDKIINLNDEAKNSDEIIENIIDILIGIRE